MVPLGAKKAIPHPKSQYSRIGSLNAPAGLDEGAQPRPLLNEYHPTIQSNRHLQADKRRPTEQKGGAHAPTESEAEIILVFEINASNKVQTWGQMSFILLLKAQESAFSFAVFNHFINFVNINLILTTHGKDEPFTLYYGGV